MPPMKLALVHVGKLKPAAYNPRHMPDEELAALARSMTEFGVVDPIIANKEGTVIGGHQRLKAAQIAGIETLPVVYVDMPKDKPMRHAPRPYSVCRAAATTASAAWGATISTILPSLASVSGS